MSIRNRKEPHDTNDIWPGPTFWDTPALTFFHLDKVELVTRYIPNVGLNETAMALGAGLLGFNIVTR